MKIRSLFLIVGLSIGILAWHSASADNDSGGNEVVVALIDTGAKVSHQEFDYEGKDSTTDQVVAWWDFSGETQPALLPSPGQTWDPRVDNPFDNNGHGTATASAAVGLNKNATKEKSFAPGFKLAIAKVGEGDGAITGDITAALRWLVDSVKADVVNISIGPLVPIPSNLYDIDEAITYARSKGVLIVVSNGNGHLNAGIPGNLGWASPFSNINSFSVGGSGLATGVQIHSDPEVAAKFTQRLASKSCDSCYANFPGTSFSSPLVAGMAAKLMETAVADGQSASPEYIETLLKYSATDSTTPPSFEGYGILDGVSFPPALTHAAAGTLPARPNPDVSGAYVENVSNNLRRVWSEDLDFFPLASAIGAGVGTLTASGVIGPSVPMGLQEGEIFTIATTYGQIVSLSLEYTPTTVIPDPTGVQGDWKNDIDVYAFKGTGPLYGYGFNRSTHPGGEPEHLSFMAEGGTYTIIVLGWSVTDPQPYTITGTGLMSAGEDYFISSFGSGLF